MYTFAQMYQQLASQLTHDPDMKVNFACRGLKMAREMSLTAMMTMDPRGASVFSFPGHRVVPIRFMLAELCWILAGRCDVESIASYNKSMAHFADNDDAKVISGSYGLRLNGQIYEMILKLMKDIYTRQACATIFDRTDCLSGRTHMPCNVFVQFLCRPPLLDLHVTSRSSDFVTGFSIDTFHWQALLIMMANELKDMDSSIVPNLLHYNIASLHVYDGDIEMMSQWNPTQLYVPSYEHFITMNGKLSHVIHEAKKHFDKDLSIAALMDILQIDETMLPKLIALDEMFKAHRNKVVR